MIGATEALDAAVRSQANWLQKQFGGNVVIRFNSDRKSGGAFLVDRLLDDAGIGLGVGIRDDKLVYDVILHPSLGRSGEKPRSAWSAKSLEDARRVLLRKVGPCARMKTGADISTMDVAPGDVIGGNGTRYSNYVVTRTLSGIARVKHPTIKGLDRPIPLTRIASVVRGPTVHSVRHKRGTKLRAEEIMPGDWIDVDTDEDAIVSKINGNEVVVADPTRGELTVTIPASRIVHVRRGDVVHEVRLGRRAASGATDAAGNLVLLDVLYDQRQARKRMMEMLREREARALWRRRR
jgi:hypothetical protein